MNAFTREIKNRFDTIKSSVGLRTSSPDELFGELFQDVQLRRIYPDGMTFVDMLPTEKLDGIIKQYKEERHDPNFNLERFVRKHFLKFISSSLTAYDTNPDHTIEQHINALWPILKRESYKNVGSLMALPKPYIVAGGRFGAQFYWDSYFIMLGLAAAKDWHMVENMTKNCAYLIRKIGYMPTANRTYYISRSQPPFFAMMVRLLMAHEGKLPLLKYLPAMLAEYKFWMKGARKIKGKMAYARVVRMPDGELLNRYYDDKSTPRPESYQEDILTAVGAKERQPSRVYLDLRAAAESGWDFSSRWLSDYKHLQTVKTTSIVPIDLNCLLVVLEQTIAEAYGLLLQRRKAKRYRHAALLRADAINKYLWDWRHGFYYDLDFTNGEHTKVVSGAALFPLYVGVATKDQAKLVAAKARRELLKKGGLLCTTLKTGQQWDAPNGWAPLHWVAIKGLRAYDLGNLADEIKRRWLMTVKGVFTERGKLVEKYNVVEPGASARGGEYPLQDGFGWTNGTTLALLHEDTLKLG